MMCATVTRGGASGVATAVGSGHRPRLIHSAIITSYLSRFSGLLNRLNWEDAVAGAFPRLPGGGRAVSLLMLDIEHLQSITDPPGHPGGGVVLRSVAAILRASLGDDFDNLVLSEIKNKEAIIDSIKLFLGKGK